MIYAVGSHQMVFIQEFVNSDSNAVLDGSVHDCDRPLNQRPNHGEEAAKVDLLQEAKPNMDTWVLCPLRTCHVFFPLSLLTVSLTNRISWEGSKASTWLKLEQKVNQLRIQKHPKPLLITAQWSQRTHGLWHSLLSWAMIGLRTLQRGWCWRFCSNSWRQGFDVHKGYFNELEFSFCFFTFLYSLHNFTISLLQLWTSFLLILKPGNHEFHIPASTEPSAGHARKGTIPRGPPGEGWSKACRVGGNCFCFTGKS